MKTKAIVVAGALFACQGVWGHNGAAMKSQILVNLYQVHGRDSRFVSVTGPDGAPDFHDLTVSGEGREVEVVWEVDPEHDAEEICGPQPRSRPYEVQPCKIWGGGLEPADPAYTDINPYAYYGSMSTRPVVDWSDYRGRGRTRSMFIDWNPRDWGGPEDVLLVLVQEGSSQSEVDVKDHVHYRVPPPPVEQPEWREVAFVPWMPGARSEGADHRLRMVYRGDGDIEYRITGWDKTGTRFGGDPLGLLSPYQPARLDIRDLEETIGDGEGAWSLLVEAKVFAAEVPGFHVVPLMRDGEGFEILPVVVGGGE